MKRYPDRAKTAYEHAWEIRDAYGFRVFEDEAVSIEFRRFLDGRAWTLDEGPAALFEAGGRLAAPALGVAAGGHGADQVGEHGSGCGRGPDAHPARDRRHGDRSDAARKATRRAAQWHRSPTRVSGPGMVKALDRASQLAGLRVR